MPSAAQLASGRCTTRLQVNGQAFAASFDRPFCKLQESSMTPLYEFLVKQAERFNDCDVDGLDSSEH